MHLKIISGRTSHTRVSKLNSRSPPLSARPASGYYSTCENDYALPLEKTSSSAVAKNPRDATCLSVVSFNSTKPRTESVIDSYVGYRFVTACN